MGRVSRSIHRWLAVPASAVVFAGCSGHATAPTAIAGDDFDRYDQTSQLMRDSWSTGLLLQQPSGYDGTAHHVQVALGPSYTYGRGYSQDKATTRRAFGPAEGLRANTSYRVTIAHRVRANSAGSYPQDSRSISGMTANGASALVQFDGVASFDFTPWRLLSLLANTDASGNLVIEFGLFQNSGFFTYVDFDDLQIR